MLTGSRLLPIESIDESATNPRKNFDAEKLEELKASILNLGVVQPIIVRPKSDRFELVAGARRVRAVKLAGLSEIPGTVRELSDVEALEIQVIENGQRDDLHPLEEAAGYKALLDQGYDIQKLASRIGRSVKYVYDRVKLLQLAPAARKLFEEGKMTAGHAILVARLEKDDQLRTIASREDGGGLFTRENVVDHHPDLSAADLRAASHEKPVSVRELEEWIDENVRLEPSNPDLPQLFPDAADAIGDAIQEEEKVVLVTRANYIPKETRLGDRIVFPRSWKRADGEEGSKTCGESVMGFVAVGPGRGEAFDVCIAKKTCKVHWTKEQKKNKKNAIARAAADPGPGLGKSSMVSARELMKAKAEEQARKLLVVNLAKLAEEADARVIIQILAGDLVRGFGVIELVRDRYGLDLSSRDEKKRLAALDHLTTPQIQGFAILTLAEDVVDEYNAGGIVCAGLGVDYKKEIKVLSADILKQLEREAREAKKAAEKVTAPKAAPVKKKPKRAKSKKTTKAARKKKASTAELLGEVREPLEGSR